MQPRCCAVIAGAAFFVAACWSGEDTSESAADCDDRPVQAVSGLVQFRDCPYGPVMVALPPGRFVMGSPDGEEPAALNPVRPEWTERSEKPQVEVQIAASFAMGMFEVTFREWGHCVAAGGCSHQPRRHRRITLDHPVHELSRADAEEYVAWLSNVTGQRYRLPSEAEWEYAARAGTTTARHWGDELGVGNTVCDGCGSRWDRRSPAPVGSFAPNAFGLHDMLGNVGEWVADCWTPSHEGAPRDASPRIEASPWFRNGECERPVQRGGAFSHYPWTVRAAARSYWWPGPWSERSQSYGVRVVREIGAPTP